MAGPVVGSSSAAPHRGFLSNLAHLFEQGATDVKSMALGSAGAAVQGAEYAATHWPWETASHLPGLFEQSLEQTWQDIQHPGRHPGYLLADLLGLAPIPGAALARVGRVGTVAARAGRLAPDLEEATRPFLQAGDYAGAKAAAKALGKQDEFTRAVKKEGPVSAGRQLTTELVSGAPREARVLTDPQGNQQFGWFYSRDPTIKAAQKLIDRAYATFPNGTPPWPARVLPPFYRTQAGRISKAVYAQRVQMETAMGVRGIQLWKKWGDVPDPVHLAARMVLEGTTGDVLRAFHERMLASNKLSPVQIAETHRRIAMIPEAEQHLDTKRITLEGDHALKGHTFEVPVPKPGAIDLQSYVDEARSVSQEREFAAELAGVLSPASAISRTIGPLHFALHDKAPEYGESIQHMEARLARVKAMNPQNPDVWQELQDQIKTAKEAPPIPEAAARELADKAGLTRIPYEVPGRNPLNFIAQPFRRSYKGQSRPGPPSSFTHPYLGKIQKGGGGDPNTARVLAASYSEAARFIALRNNWQRILASVRPTPEGIPEGHRVLVKTQYGSFVPSREQAMRFIESGRRMTAEESLAGGLHYDGVRAELFPKKNLWGQIKAKAGIVDEQIEPIPGYGWADDRLLGGLNKQNPLLGVLSSSPLARRVANFYDFANTAMKTATLYLRPAYIMPNLFGNVFLNLIQQGFMAPWNIYRSVISYGTMKKETRGSILKAMGEGGTSALQAGPGGFFAGAARAQRALSRFYGKAVDEPFRMSSFLHEARQAGYSTQKELDRLVTDADLHDQFLEIAQRANDEIINYERLGPSEQAILRRAIFFYPWIKGSSRYALGLAREHPIQAGVLGQAGAEQTARTEELLGPLPSYLEGIFPTSIRGNIATVQNPNSLGPLSSFADLIARAQNLTSGTPDPKLAITELLSPVDRAGLSFLTAGAASGQFGKATQSALKSGLLDYLGRIPPYTLYTDLAPAGFPLANRKKPTAIYPQATTREALLKFLFSGGLTPRPLDIANANYSAYLTAHPRG